MKEKIKEFKNEDIAILVETQEEYDKLMQILEENECKWGAGELPTKRDFFGRYEELCIEYDDEHLYYADKDFYENGGYKIITFKEFIGEYKVIDVLIAMSKGKPIKSFIYHDYTYKYEEEFNDYKDEDLDWFFNEYSIELILNEEIQIVEDYEESCEESHNIKPIRIIYGAPNNPLNEVISKLNEVIEELNRRGE